MGTDLDSLATPSLFGHEIRKKKAMSKLEIVKGIGSLIFLAALAVAACYRVADMNSAIALEIGEPDIDRYPFEACLRSFI
ncbi:hypothetical protein EH240_35745 [Mesorhizobium tamadayense]|uniref:Uncharacterized protein n=1 Tax=Mesorhizobium tamadayense TaxID=425306 RepID=A0A3P3EN59_9HYPH|nr:hypothetical protein [Mesorhizobium tamadayense]RRH87843.1 hypothetical protein EH240_35745 [Mesorhizobium tamadayense]